VALLTLIFELLSLLVRLYVWALILAALFSMLASFSIIDTRNRLVWSIGEFLERVTEPVLRPIRRVMPQFGSVDLSPLVAVLVLQFVVGPLLGRLYTAIETGTWQPLVY
jgi:YggT family protein